MNNTHMPFFARHGEETLSLCCRKVDGHWKIHRLEGGEWVRLATQRPADATECSPTAEFADGHWRITFIAGGAEGDRLFRLYQYIDGAVSVLKAPACVGFANRKMLVHGGRERRFTIELADGALKKVFESDAMEELFRVSFDADRPHRLLLSGRCNGAVCSWIYDLGSDRVFDLEADGGPAYKCAFFEGRCFYARQTGEGFEDREVVEAREVKVTPVSRNLYTTRWEE